jgi:hypothetical protein
VRNVTLKPFASVTNTSPTSLTIEAMSHSL